MDRGHAKIILAVVLVVVVAGVIALIVLPTGSRQKCQPLGDPQHMSNEIDSRLLADATFSALANFTGYLEYGALQEGDKPRYIDVHVTSLERLGAKDEISLALGSECASLRINTTPPSVKTIEVQLVTPNHNDTICRTDNLGWLSESNRHYFCDSPLKLTCYRLTDHATKVATLVVKAFEFEVNAKPELAKQGKFTTERNEIACRQRWGS